MKAVIMAGGKASRFGNNIEKALIVLQGKTLLDRVIHSLKCSSISEITVSVSENTPKTAEFCEINHIDFFMSPGKGYHEDLYDLLDKFGNFISLNVDCPFVAPDDINFLIESIGEISIACVVPKDYVPFSIDDQSILKDANGRQYVWIGLNYVTYSKDMELLESSKYLLALNINTPADLESASMYLKQNAGN